MSRPTSLHRRIVSKKVALPKGAQYAPALLVEAAGAMLFVSGQLPVDNRGAIFVGDIKIAADMVLKALADLLMQGGFQPSEVVSCTVYLTSLELSTAFFEVYHRIFRGLVQPTCSVMAVAALPQGAAVMLSAIAVKNAPPLPAPAKESKQKEEEKEEG